MKLALPIAILILSTRLTAFSQCQPATAKSFLDINNVKAMVLNGGDLWWNLDNNPEYVVPKESDISSLFAGALWIGGVDGGGNLHMAAQTYRQNGNDFFPGPLNENGEVSPEVCMQFDHLYKVDQSTIDSFIAGLLSVIPQNILEWPGRGNPYTSIPNQDLAPFIDVNGDGIYDPASGDYPKIKGDQAIWWVFNDVGNDHTETGSIPLGIEVQAMAFTFKIPELQNITFYNYKIIQKAAADYDSVLIGLWLDPDVGCLVNDYVGSVPEQNLVITYNASQNDTLNVCLQDFANRPPLVGLQVVQFPIENGSKVPFHSAMAYNNDFTVVGNPEEAADYYNYLDARWKDGSHLTFGGDGYAGTTPTNFIYSDPPTLADGWSECAQNAPPGEQRIVMSVGPMSLDQGNTKEFTFDVLWYQPASEQTSCESFDPIIELADAVQDFYDRYTGEENTQPSSSYISMNIFPNPATSSAVIRFSDNQYKEIRIMNIFGETVMDTESQDNLFILSLKGLTKGIYLIEAKIKSGIVSSEKLVVE